MTHLESMYGLGLALEGKSNLSNIYADFLRAARYQILTSIPLGFKPSEDQNKLVAEGRVLDGLIILAKSSHVNDYERSVLEQHPLFDQVKKFESGSNDEISKIYEHISSIIRQEPVKLPVSHKGS